MMGLPPFYDPKLLESFQVFVSFPGAFLAHHAASKEPLANQQYFSYLTEQMILRKAMPLPYL